MDHIKKKKNVDEFHNWQNFFPREFEENLDSRCFQKFSNLHNSDVLEAHPGSQRCTDQDAADHHDLLPE